jgi:pentatricopeptide repeat protein
MIEQHPVNLRPDVYTFGTMFKCLSRVQQNDAGRQAADLVLDMERRYKEGDLNLKPTSVSYTMAIKIALGVDDWETAEMLMMRAKTDSSVSTILDVRAYNAILRFLSQRGTISAAEHAERILKEHMKLPDVISFTTVMRAWTQATSTCTETEERVYNLYRHMKSQQKVAPNIVTFQTLIPFFSSLHTPQALARAESLLNDMIASNENDLSPDHRHYIPVLTGYAEIHDALNARRILERYIADYINRVDRDEIISSRPVPANFDVVLRAYLRNGDIDGATAFIDEMQKLKDDGKIPEGPDYRTYSGLLSAWKALSDEDDSERRDWQILRLQKIVDDLQWLP